ncbi:hypothetical protein SANA_07850 [Gottschalkiaceae bacterium SANA]|nr:hypothetical protein SANA_07850 [Gottschalkiaceae bacterium SANA]
MQFRLRTSGKAQELLLELKNATKITPNILSRYAIALSVKQQKPLEELEYDVSGLEFNRHVLTGNFDATFKSLISQREERELTDEEYFPHYIKLHLERGIRMLKAEYDYAGNTEKFLINLMNYAEGGTL